MSNSVVRDAIAASVAEIEQVQKPPVEPFGYGTDMSCDSDLPEDMADVDGNTTLALAQAVVHRLDCPRGGVPDDRDYGIDLRSYCNRGTTADDIRRLGDRIHSEIMKDDRITSVEVTVSPSADTRTLGIQIALRAADPSVSPFRLILAVTSAEVILQELLAA